MAWKHGKKKRRKYRRYYTPEEKSKLSKGIKFKFNGMTIGINRFPNGWKYIPPKNNKENVKIVEGIQKESDNSNREAVIAFDI